jgi:CheY-like chemotaxis protein
VVRTNTFSGAILFDQSPPPIPFWKDGKTEDGMPRLLIADDFGPMRNSLRLYLEAKGFGSCVEAANGQEALRLAKQTKPDVVILDYSMPIMNGAEAAKAFQREMPEVPVLLLTAYGESAQRALDPNLHVAVYPKENITSLVRAISDYLRNKEKPSTARS